MGLEDLNKYKEQYLENDYGNTEVQTLKKLFSSLFGSNMLTTFVEEGIEEQYNLIKSRELNAYKWLSEAFYITSKKEETKRNFSYIVGMIRQWLKYGFRHLPSQEEDEIIEFFEEINNIEVSIQTRQIIKKLMGTYGGIRVMRVLSQQKCNDIDMSKVKALLLKNLLEEKYPMDKN